MSVFHKKGDALVWEQKHETVCIEPWGRNSLRVRATMAPAIRRDLPSALLPPATTAAQVTTGEDNASITNGALTAEVSAKTFAIRFRNTASEVEYLAEEAPRFRWPPVRDFRPVGGDLYHLDAWFKAYDGERLYGLGQHQHGRLDQKGCVVDLLQCNTEVTIPFMVSSRGYGFLWNNPAVGRVELGASATRWVAEATAQLDYWITAGDTPAEIMARYADATGHTPMMPEWALGFWQSKLRYASQDELLSVAREHKRRGLPLAVIVIDFFHWTVQGEWQFDPVKWPDPAAMVRELEEMGVRVLISAWGTVSMHSRNYQEMRRRGLLVRGEQGNPPTKPFRDTRPEGQVDVQWYDATNPEARKYFWQKLKEGYYRYGIKLWWLDACEPDIHPFHAHNWRYHLGNGAAVTNIYSMLHEQGVYEGMKEEGEQDVVNLCRSAWAGSQRYGVILWSGDIDSTFEVLRAQVRAGLNAAMSGIPWWNSDIGGFFNGHPDDPHFRELLVRWFQYGVFCPITRLHGYREPAQRATITSGGPNEVWSYGDEVYTILKDLLFLRERLKPYIMQQMKVAHETGIPPMRPLFFDFPKDPGCAAVEDEYMFGPDLLVAPVLVEGARSRPVYLPAGTAWVDAWSEKVFAGGQTVAADAPLERIPVYLRQGVKAPVRG